MHQIFYRIFIRFASDLRQNEKLFSRFSSDSRQIFIRFKDKLELRFRFRVRLTKFVGFSSDLYPTRTQIRSDSLTNLIKIWCEIPKKIFFLRMFHMFVPDSSRFRFLFFSNFCPIPVRFLSDSFPILLFDFHPMLSDFRPSFFPALILSATEIWNFIDTRWLKLIFKFNYRNFVRIGRESIRNLERIVRNFKSVFRSCLNRVKSVFGRINKNIRRWNYMFLVVNKLKKYLSNLALSLKYPRIRYGWDLEKYFFVEKFEMKNLKW